MLASANTPTTPPNAAPASPSRFHRVAAPSHLSPSFWMDNLLYFVISRTIGQGSFGRVFLVRNFISGTFFALKVMKKQRVLHQHQVQHVRDERELLGSVKCPYVVRLERSFQDSLNLYFLMEYVPGGELFTLLRNAGRLTRAAATFYVCELVVTLEHLHEQGIAYRDLKPENILIDQWGHVRLVDFGFAKRVTKKGFTYTMCGTPEYLAPEVITGVGHGLAVDWWSLGILLYELLVGTSPFSAQEPMRIYELILAGNYSFPPFLEDASIDLISKLLVADTSRRLGNLIGGAKDIMEHEFFLGTDWDSIRAWKHPELVIPSTHTHSTQHTHSKRNHNQMDVSTATTNEGPSIETSDNPRGTTTAPSCDIHLEGFEWSSEQSHKAKEDNTNRAISCPRQRPHSSSSSAASDSSSFTSAVESDIAPSSPTQPESTRLPSDSSTSTSQSSRMSGILDEKHATEAGSIKEQHKKAKATGRSQFIHVPLKRASSSSPRTSTSTPPSTFGSSGAAEAFLAATKEKAASGAGKEQIPRLLNLHELHPSYLATTPHHQSVQLQHAHRHSPQQLGTEASIADLTLSPMVSPHSDRSDTSSSFLMMIDSIEQDQEMELDHEPESVDEEQIPESQFNDHLPPWIPNVDFVGDSANFDEYKEDAELHVPIHYETCVYPCKVHPQVNQYIASYDAAGNLLPTNTPPPSPAVQARSTNFWPETSSVSSASLSSPTARPTSNNQQQQVQQQQYAQLQQQQMQQHMQQQQQISMAPVMPQAHPIAKHPFAIAQHGQHQVQYGPLQLQQQQEQQYLAAAAAQQLRHHATQSPATSFVLKTNDFFAKPNHGWSSNKPSATVPASAPMPLKVSSPTGFNSGATSTDPKNHMESAAGSNIASATGTKIASPKPIAARQMQNHGFSNHSSSYPPTASSSSPSFAKSAAQIYPSASSPCVPQSGPHDQQAHLPQFHSPQHLQQHQTFHQQLQSSSPTQIQQHAYPTTQYVAASLPQRQYSPQRQQQQLQQQLQQQQQQQLQQQAQQPQQKQQQPQVPFIPYANACVATPSQHLLQPLQIRHPHHPHAASQQQQHSQLQQPHHRF